MRYMPVALEVSVAEEFRLGSSIRQRRATIHTHIAGAEQTS